MVSGKDVSGRLFATPDDLLPVTALDDVYVNVFKALKQNTDRAFESLHSEGSCIERTQRKATSPLPPSPTVGDKHTGALLGFIIPTPTNAPTLSDRGGYGDLLGHIPITPASPPTTRVPYSKPEGPSTASHSSDASTQLDKPTVSNSETGPDKPKMTDTGIQPNKPKMTDTGIQPDKPKMTDTGIQPDKPKMTDTGIQPDKPKMTDTGIQPNKPKMTDTGIQPNKPKMTDTGIQPDKPKMTDTGIQPDKPKMTDTGIQPDKPKMTDTGIQPDKPKMTDTGIQPDKPKMTDTGIQPNKPKMTDTGIQPNKPKMTDTGIQPDKPKMTDTGIQPDKPKMTDTGIQPDKPKMTDTGIQPDKPIVSDFGTGPVARTAVDGTTQAEQPLLRSSETLVSGDVSTRTQSDSDTGVGISPEDPSGSSERVQSTKPESSPRHQESLPTPPSATSNWTPGSLLLGTQWSSEKRRSQLYNWERRWRAAMEEPSLSDREATGVKDSEEAKGKGKGSEALRLSGEKKGVWEGKTHSDSDSQSDDDWWARWRSTVSAGGSAKRSKREEKTDSDHDVRGLLAGTRWGTDRRRSQLFRIEQQMKRASQD
uniref:Uncharacterized protein n=1 Tax=Chromera velia CCMP2878 TaxID=1169474 RepID=A0A0G4IDS2_9ALVE|eukprot:Cvel_2338.t1-p1 / transcript=Cvel_2338.t1 / gene=Cvel_2338 / organism=Chromera_velia_CCMP2878 / gene_product=DNA-directed RNA polymerase II subunit RPB1, putative / transcript_product=DNA-directed RNA polymerase II subunit RPB1, putative / location=Cvel_scaffold90:104659-106431(-) / protein_length=591 / sequence_SO=supercontig / SO=protein_coding / is_pseudo=false